MSYKEKLHKKFPKFSFEKFNSTKSNEKSIIICPQHGEFINSYKELIRQKFGCKKCRPLVDQHIQNICIKHGQYTYFRYNNSNCPKCRSEKARNTHEQFLLKLGDTKLNILTKYENSDKHILVENEFGKVLVTPSHLLKGKKPSIISAINKTEYCIKQFKKIHGDFYDYSKVKYENSLTKVVVCCPLHGEYRISPVSHNQGSECKKCAYDKLDIGFTLKDFIRIASKKLCTLYLVKINTENESFVKIGITSRDLKTRLSKHKYEIIDIIINTDAEYIFKKEKELHKKLKKYSYLPNFKFNGYRECYDINNIKEIADEFSAIQTTIV